MDLQLLSAKHVTFTICRTILERAHRSALRVCLRQPSKGTSIVTIGRICPKSDPLSSKGQNWERPVIRWLGFLRALNALVREAVNSLRLLEVEGWIALTLLPCSSFLFVSYQRVLGCFVIDKGDAR